MEMDSDADDNNNLETGDRLMPCKNMLTLLLLGPVIPTNCLIIVHYGINFASCYCYCYVSITTAIVIIRF